MTDPIDILAPFSMAKFCLTLVAIETLQLQEFKGSALRGAFGYAFRKSACLTGGNDCRFCPLALKCVYAYIFETPVSKDDAFLRNRDAAAHPYIIRPPLDNKRFYRPGEELVFELILIGKAIDYLAYFAEAFIIMGAVGLGKGTGKFFLKRIEGRDAGQISIYYLSGDEHLRNTLNPVTGKDLFNLQESARRCIFHFVSRLELKEKGKYPIISFGVLFRSLLRRVVTLAHLHNGIDCSGFDFSGLSHAADEVATTASDMVWEEAERYSNRQQGRMPFSGLLGSVTFEGNLAPFWPFLILGQWVHVGKKTSFGFGRYELIAT